MPDATEDLVEQIGHPFMVQVHVDYLTQVGIHQLHHKVTTRKAMKKNNDAADIRNRTHSNHIALQKETISELLRTFQPKSLNTTMRKFLEPLTDPGTPPGTSEA